MEALVGGGIAGGGPRGRPRRVDRAAALALTVAALSFGCQRAAPPAPTVAVSSVSQLQADGDALLRRNEYAAAAAKYESAVQLDPHNIALRFGLGTALSHLDRREDTTRQFRWIVRHGRPQTREVHLARQWLANAGERPDQAEVLRAAASGPAGSRVKGKTEWTGIDPKQRLVPLHVFLEDEASGQVKFARRFRLGESYEFRDVPPGSYRLVAKVDQTHLWEQKLKVEADQDTVLDLSPANSPLTPDQLPASAGDR